jgi:intron-binding protein aquarius
LKIASDNWAGEGKAFDACVVETIYTEQLKASRYALSRIMCLEYSQYLEKYLWPNFDPEASSDSHVISIVLVVNEKFREQVMSWEPFEKRPELFPALFNRAVDLHHKEATTHTERTMIILFLIHCFQSLENSMVRAVALAQVALPLWQHLSFNRLELEMKQAPHLEKKWKAMRKKQKKEGVDKSKEMILPGLIQELLKRLAFVPAQGKVELDLRRYLERMLELLIDLVAQLPTRRFFLAVLIDQQVVVRCRMSALARRREGRLFVQLLDLLKFYQDFEINEHTGVSLSQDEMLARHYGRLQLLQRHAYALFPDSMKDFALANIGAIENREALFAHLAGLSKEDLMALLQKVRLVPKESSAGGVWEDHQLLLEVATAYHERRISQLDAINALPLYPTESLLWDENVVPSINYTGEQVLALPKLNLQYLTFHDYLLRNFNLFRLESTYEIRQDVEDVALRLRPRLDQGRTIFQGWSRASLPLSDFTVVEVAKPNLGETRPAHVLGEATYSLEGVRDFALRKEWENFREHDIVFLLTITAKYRVGEHPPHQEGRSAADFCLTYIRGAEVVGMLDEDGKIINRLNPDAKGLPRGHVRRVRVHIDPQQYAVDAAARQGRQGAEEGSSGGGDSVYSSFNVIMKRKAQENNFKAVLECIRQLMNADIQVPTPHLSPLAH